MIQVILIIINSLLIFWNIWKVIVSIKAKQLRLFISGAAGIPLMVLSLLNAITIYEMAPVQRWLALIGMFLWWFFFIVEINSMLPQYISPQKNRR